MSDRDFEKGEIETPAAADAAPAEGAATAQPDQAKKEFVPFFNEDYQFRLGTLGDVDTAYRLGGVFIIMLIAAALMYIAAYWWADRNRAVPAPTAEVVATSPEHSSGRASSGVDR